MEQITKENVEKLATIEKDICISIYISVEPLTDNTKNKLKFKNQIQHARKQLHELGLKERDILAYIDPLVDLLSNESAWRKYFKGFAVFVHKDDIWLYDLPVDVETMCVVSHHFYVLPLLQVFNGNERFYLLQLSLKKVALYKGNRDSFNKIDLGERMPSNMEDVVGRDYEQKSLQFRQGQSGGNQESGMFHGHGAGKDDKKVEVVKFLREVESHVSDYLKDDKAPLVIAAVEYVYGHYKEINSYQNVYHENLSGNFDEKTESELHKLAWNHLKDYFREEIENTKKLYYEQVGHNKASKKLDEILRAAEIGMIDTLLVEKGSQIWGTYQEEQQKVDITDSPDIENECLLDKSARATFLQGGKVLLVDKDDLPESEAHVNAIFRY
ncbi:MAG: hypothetical protein ACOC0C_02690 [Bacteroidota bacterium]